MAKPMHITGMLCTNGASETPYYHNRPEFQIAPHPQRGAGALEGLHRRAGGQARDELIE
jgi:hypothetical protein